jgi:DNA polymerase-3 subunit delta
VPPQALLFGREQFLVHGAAGALAERSVPEALRGLDFVKLDGAETDLDTLVAHCETLPLSGGRRVVLLAGALVFSGEGGRGAGRLDEEGFLKYLGKLPESCLLILTAEKVDKRRKLYKAAAAAGGAYEFTRLDPAQLHSFIDKRLRAAGRRAGPRVLRDFAEMTGYFDKESEYSLYHLENDINKLLAYAEGEEIRLSDVAAILSLNASFNVFALTDAVSRGRRGDAFQRLSELLSSGESVYRLLALLFSQFELLLCVREMAEAGLSRGEMRQILAVHEFRLGIAAEQAERFSVKGLREILRQACEADKNIKTGLLQDSLALEMFIYAATSRGRA